MNRKDLSLSITSYTMRTRGLVQNGTFLNGSISYYLKDR